MVKKKVENKKNSKKKDTVIAVDTVMEDMKKLALQEEEPKEETVSEIVENVETTEEPATEEVIEESKEDVAEETIENAENSEETLTEEVVETVENAENSEEDLSFIEDLKEGQNSVEEKSAKENNPKRKSYEEMFGYKWMGYGFS